MHLSLHFLGSFQVKLNENTLTASRAKKIEALLAYLAMEAERTHRREALVGLLFPELPEAQARANLRQTLTRLRRAIKDAKADPPFLLATRETTQFNLASNVTLDVLTFEEGLNGCEKHRGQRNGRCSNCIALASKSVDLYHGPFMDGFFLEDSIAFDDWVLGHRERLQQVALEALQQITDYHEMRGEYSTAESFARQQITIEPWYESAHLQLMRLLVYQGKRTAALRQYESLRTILQDELGVEPEPETESFYKQITAIKEERPYRLPPGERSIGGRDDELAKINVQLADPERRLITLVGVGGIGKTTLAIEIGRRVAANHWGPFFHGVFYVPLAEIEISADSQGSTAPLVTAVAEVLGFTFAGTQPPEKQLHYYLRDKSLLLILDNFEHLLRNGYPFVQRLLQATQHLKLLVTSRERLKMAQEWVIPIDGLSVPQTGQNDSRYALELFKQRASRLVPDFAIGPADDPSNQRCNETDVVKICQLVNGLPLGIELAATWVRMLTCEEIAAEIAQNLDFLQSTLHDVPERHQSLRAVFDYSWNLLDAKEQKVLCQLSVFRGPFDRHAAAAVAGATLPILSTLVDRSLIQQHLHDAAQGTIRHNWLEVLRQYAAGKFAETTSNEQDGETAVRNRHATYYLQLLSNYRNDLRGSRQQETLDAITQEMANIRAAWHWAVAGNNFTLIGSVTDALGLFYYVRSWFTEGAELFAAAASQYRTQNSNFTDELIYGNLLARQGWLTFLSGRQSEGQALLTESLKILRPTEDYDALAYTLNFLAVTIYTSGDYTVARQLAEEGLALSITHDDQYRMAVAYNILSQIAYLQGRYGQARTHSRNSLELENSLGNRWSMGFSLTNLGRVAYATEDFDEAETRLLEGLAIREALDDKRGQALCLLYLGDTANAQKNLPLAEERFNTSLAFFREIGNPSGTAVALNRLGSLAQKQNKIQEASDNYHEALVISDQANMKALLLDTLLGIAYLLAASQTDDASIIATLVYEHPAASPKSRNQAQMLLNKLGIDSDLPPDQDLEVLLQNIVKQLLS